MEKKIRRVKVTWDNNEHMEFLSGRVSGIMQMGSCDNYRQGYYPVDFVSGDEGHWLTKTYTCNATDDEWAKIKNFLCNGILRKVTQVVEE